MPTSELSETERNQFYFTVASLEAVQNLLQGLLQEHAEYEITNQH